MPDAAFNPEEYQFVTICPADEVPSGERIFFDVGDQPVVLLNVGGSYYAIGDVCSHDGGPVGEGEIEGCEIICPRHGARFDIRNGHATRSPAFVDIPWFPVRVTGGMVEIGVKK